MNVSEVNYTFWKNASHFETQTDREFPLWKVILSLLVLGYWFLLVLPATLMNSSVLLVAKRSSINKAIAMVHTYVLALNTIIKVCSAMTITIYIPSMIRFCFCSLVASSFSFFMHIFTISYQPFIFVSLAVLQLLIIKGEKRLVNRKSVGITLTVGTVVATLIPLLFTVVRTIDGDTFLCSGVCPRRIVAHVLILFAVYANVVWIPSVFIVIIVTVWSCLIFKRQYAGKDAELNRRIIALPLVMPITITLTTVFTFGLFRLIDRIPIFETKPFAQNWMVSIKVIILLLNEISTGLSYPCLILFLYPKLWNSWKTLFKSNIPWWKKNQVIPQ